MFFTKYKYSKAKLLQWVGLASSSYYYRVKGTRKGNKPSKYTFNKLQGWVKEETVIESIKEILSRPFIDCGYHIMTAYLRRQGYLINPKKVYRIMKQAKLLKHRVPRNHTGKKFVRFRRVETTRPFECLEMDIKVVWIPHTGKNAYLLSIMDVHSRRILKGYFSYTIKQNQVIELVSSLLEDYHYPENIVIRSDNGSQFIANKLREYLKVVGIDQEFTHIATPEENAHIEAYHGILKRDLFDKYEYFTFGEVELLIKKYVSFYNNERLHGMLGKITPMEKWNMDKHLILRKKEVA